MTSRKVMSEVFCSSVALFVALCNGKCKSTCTCMIYRASMTISTSYTTAGHKQNQSVFTQITILLISTHHHTIAASTGRPNAPADAITTETHLESEIRLSPLTPNILPIEIRIWSLLVIVCNGRWGCCTLEPC